MCVLASPTLSSFLTLPPLSLVHHPCPTDTTPARPPIVALYLVYHTPNSKSILQECKEHCAQLALLEMSEIDISIAS